MVTREGGVSWSEAGIASYHSTQEELLEARLKDTDISWLEVAGDPDWDPGDFAGRWTNLDAVSLPYYFAASMMRFLMGDEKALSPDDLMPNYKFFDLSEDFDPSDVHEEKARRTLRFSEWIRQTRWYLRFAKGSGFPSMEELTGKKQVVSVSQIVSMNLGSMDLSGEIDFTQHFRANLTPGQFRAVAEFIHYNAELPTREALLAVLDEADMTWEDYENEGGGWTPETVWSGWSRPLKYWEHHLSNGKTLAT